MEREGKDQLPANGRTYLEEMQDAAALRDALAEAHTLNESLLVTIEKLYQAHKDKDASHVADQERAAAQLAALGRDLGRAHQLYRQVVADHAALGGMLESAERECEKYRLEILKLKALLWDQAQAGANGHAAPWNEGTTI